MATPFYIDKIPNYRRFLARLRKVLKGSEHEMLHWQMRRPRGGFRLVQVYMTEGPPLTWKQPWEGDSI